MSLRWPLACLLLASATWPYWQSEAQQLPETAVPDNGVRRVANGAVAPMGEPGPPPVQCWRVGPIADLNMRAALEKNFSEQGLLPRFILRPILREVRYRVYVETGGVQAVQQEQRARLLAQDIDNYVIASGPLAGQISLGIYRQKNHAWELINHALALGFQSQLFEVEEFEQQTWLLLDDQAVALLGWPADLRQLYTKPELLVEAISCEGVGMPWAVPRAGATATPEGGVTSPQK